MSAPPWVNVAASCQPPSMPWSSSQSVISSSRSEASSGLSGVALHTSSTAFSWNPIRLTSAARSDGPAAIMPSLDRIAGDPAAQRVGGADRRRGRVVQLVGEPGRQRAESEQPLPLTDRLLGVPGAEEQPFEQVGGHREPVGMSLAKLTESSRKNREGSVTRIELL